MTMVGPLLYYQFSGLHLCPVPTYDGRNGVSLSEYSKLPRISTEMPDGTPVLVIFTVTSWEYKGDLPHIDTTAMFNIQRVVQLGNDPSDDSQTEDDSIANDIEDSIGVEQNGDPEEETPAAEAGPSTVLL
jgi:hypothetical protein